MTVKHLIFSAMLIPGIGLSSGDPGSQDFESLKTEQRQVGESRHDPDICQVKVNPRRCFNAECRKKLNIVNTFTCSLCTSVFNKDINYCTSHRYHSDHNIGPEDAEFKKHQEKLKKALPQVIADKIERI